MKCTLKEAVMKANFLDFRKHTKNIIKALELNETVTVMYRGKEKGKLYPTGSQKNTKTSVKDHPVFGMWKNRQDMTDPVKYVRKIRESRHDF